MPSIWVSSNTKRKLDELRHLGQSYNGVIQELIQEVKKQKKAVKPLKKEWY